MKSDKFGPVRKIMFSKTISSLILVLILTLVYLIFVIPIMASSSGGSELPSKRDTANATEKNLKSLARVNPSSLAMEMNIPIFSYPGRNGNSLPVEFRYSSNLWRLDDSHTWWYPVGQNNRQYVTDIFALFAEHSASGWTSSLLPPRIDEEEVSYNVLGKIYGDSVNEQGLNDSFNIALYSILEQSSAPSLAGSLCNAVCTRAIVNVNNQLGDIYCLEYTHTRCSSPYDDPDPVPEVLDQNHLYYVKRRRVVMPDGSSHEFRQSDQPSYCGDFQNGCTGSFTGAFPAVDGSGMMLNIDTTETSLMMPDGGRYTFSGTVTSTGGKYADSYTDVNGNKMTYTETAESLGTDGTWKDTLGRQITDPIPHTWYTQTLTAGSQNLTLPGLYSNSTGQQYNLKWENLKPRGCETSTDVNCIGYDEETTGGALEDQTQKLYYSNRFLCNGNLKTDLWPDPNTTAEVLFKNHETGVRPCNPFDVLRDNKGDPILDGQGNPTIIGVRFNPVVLSEIMLPNGRSYKFAYNRHGEISKITYPTGAYETFTYNQIPRISGTYSWTYGETNRGVSERRVYDSAGNLEQRWTYLAERTGSYPNVTYKITTTAPLASNALGTGSKTESYITIDQTGFDVFGFSDIRVGRPYDERSYDENGVLRSRSLTEYITKDSSPLYGMPPRSDVRVKSGVSISIENGKALAVLNENEYEVPGQNGAPVDADYFAHLNVKRSKSHHYREIPLGIATNGTISEVAGYFNNSSVAVINETDYQYNADYRARGISSLPIETRIRDKDNNILAKTQTVYDEAAYLAGTSDNLPVELTSTWVDPSTDQSIPANSRSLRGRATTSRLWDSGNNVWIQTHTQYDQYGNTVKVWEVNEDINSSRYTETEYSDEYGCAYPTKVTTPGPDPTNTHGTSDGSFVTTTYDFNTGLPLSVTNEFGQTTATEYDDLLLRPTRSFATNFTAPESQTIYDDINRTVKVRKQIDATNWDEATTFSDSLGRTIKTQAKDSQGDVFAETHYDLLGRIDRVTNPYRTGDTVFWSKTRYDETGRAVETFAPIELPNLASAESLGITSFDISTVSNYVGTVVTTTDASGRKGRSITNALGQLTRVDEPTAFGGTADSDLGTISQPAQPTSYKYDVYGKMVEVTQEAQKRWFKYDSLGRLIRVRQPEQEVNTALNLSDAFNTSGEWTAGFSYDVLGNVLTATDAKGTVITNTYDRAGRVKTRTYSNEPQGITTPVVSFYYDGKGLASPQTPNYAKGKLTKVASSVSETQYQLFDMFGRLTQMAQITDGSTYTSKYTYNFAGALVEEEYPSGRKVKNEFETDGDLSRIYGRAANGVDRTYANSFTYTPDGKIESLRLGNLLWEKAKFNNRLQTTEIALGQGPDSGNLWKLGYEYGEIESNGTLNPAKNTGNIARQTVSFSGLAQPFIQSYKYDSLYRLTEAKETKNGNQTWIQQFGYDRYGNRLSTSQNVNAVNINTTPAVDANTNRFTSSNYQYDKNGNVTQDTDAVTNQSRTFVFNGDNKQIEIKDVNNAVIGRYYYDGEGKRVKKVTNLETTVYVFSSGKLAAEYSTATPPTAPTTSYTATDMLGSPRVLTNAIGQIISRRDFLPFGEELYADGQNRTIGSNYSQSGEDSVRKRFTGYEKDKETGLDFAEARMYENRNGRFTAVDPLLASGKNANPQTFNRYVYSLNRPLTHTDPTGMQVGKWYFPVDGEGNRTSRPEYIRNGADTKGYVEAAEKNRAGDLVYGGDGIDPNFVVRLNPMGPASINNPLDLDDMLFNGPYVRNGWDTIRSDASEDSFVEHPADGYVRGSEMAITPFDVALFCTPFKTSAGASVTEKVGSRSLPILNPHFTPDAMAVGRNFTNLASSQLAENPSLFRSVLSQAEYAAGQSSSKVARMQFGNAVERQFWNNVNNPQNIGRNLFQRLGGPGRPDGMAGGQAFDITTNNMFTVKRHFTRPYGQGLKIFQYQRPSYFTTLP